MLEWKFEDALPLLAHFLKGCPEKNAEKSKIKISVSYLVIIRPQLSALLDFENLIEKLTTCN